MNSLAYPGNNPLRWTDPLGLYGRDVHYKLTYKWALEAGIDPRIAQRIAEANQSVDEVFWQRPENFLTGLQFHFRKRAAAEQDLMKCVYFRQIDEFGRQLHQLQDTFSHQTIDPITHLYIGEAPDFYSPKSPRDQAMEQATRLWLREFKRALDKARPPRW
jgi:hypothetical protein